MNSIAFLPYIGKMNKINIAGYDIWSFYDYYEGMFEDTEIIENMKQIFSIFHERKCVSKGIYEDVKIEDIIVITPNKYVENGYSLSKEDIININSIVHILAFSSCVDLSINGTFTDTFKLEVVNFSPDKEGFRTYQTAFSKIEYVKILKPYQSTNLFVPVSKTSFVEMLEIAMIHRTQKPIERVFRALEQYYYACSIDDRVTHYNRMLNLVMAFEVLLKFKDKIDFMIKISKYNINQGIVKVEKRTIRIKGKPRDYKASLSQWWAYDMYNLRNCIVHGGEIDWGVDKYGTIQKRLRFGGVLLKNLIVSILYEMDLEDSRINIRSQFIWGFEFDTDKILISEDEC